MHDIKFIRENPEKFDNSLSSRGERESSSFILDLDKKRRQKLVDCEEIKALKNNFSNKIKNAIKNNEKTSIIKLKEDVSIQKIKISELESQIKSIEKNINNFLLSLPNLPDDSVPHGISENENKIIFKWGKIRKFNFKPKEHFNINSAKDLDFKNASKISGSRFVVMYRNIAKLHRAISQFMLDTHSNQHDLLETWAPVLVNEDAMIGTGQLPKFSEDSYQTNEKFWLIPTSEVSITNLVSNEIINKENLPKRFVCHSQCFRSEAGSAGKDTSGMLRQHQFEKVEMVTLCKPEDGKNELERMTNCAENILQKLEIPYRKVILCTGDLGFSAKITYDLEVWLPGQNKYREISSCSLCGDFQSRRMNARFRRENNSKPEFIHTLNGSGLAVGRCLIAVLENFQNSDGSVNIPELLSPYMNNKNKINKDGDLE